MFLIKHRFLTNQSAQGPIYIIKRDIEALYNNYMGLLNQYQYHVLQYR